MQIVEIDTINLPMQGNGSFGDLISSVEYLEFLFDYRKRPEISSHDRIWKNKIRDWAMSPEFEAISAECSLFTTKLPDSELTSEQIGGDEAGFEPEKSANPILGKLVAFAPRNRYNLRHYQEKTTLIQLEAGRSDVIGSQDRLIFNNYTI